MKKACFLLVMLLLTISCNNDNDVEPDEEILFTGITERDELGVVKSIDSTLIQIPASCLFSDCIVYV